MHTWDLSRAAGLDERLDPQEVSRAFEAMRPGIDRMRQSGNFAAPIEPAPGASEQTRLLNFTGRAV